VKNRFPYQVIVDYSLQNEQSAAATLAKLYQSIEQLENGIKALENWQTQSALSLSGLTRQPPWVYQMNERYRVSLAEKVKNLQREKLKLVKQAEQQNRELVRCKIESRKWTRLRESYNEKRAEQLLNDESKTLDDIAMSKRPVWNREEEHGTS
jgi:flagellar biosynthesis chaperone FliJ